MLRRHKIIIDTNLWISFLLTKKHSFVDELLDLEIAALVLKKFESTDIITVAAYKNIVAQM